MGFKRSAAMMIPLTKIDFAETRLETSLSFNHEISETVSLGITTQGILDSQSVVEGDLHSSYLIQFTYTPAE